MSKENPLSHHEQLRYDYLLRIYITFFGHFTSWSCESFLTPLHSRHSI